MFLGPKVIFFSLVKFDTCEIRFWICFTEDETLLPGDSMASVPGAFFRPTIP